MLRYIIHIKNSERLFYVKIEKTKMIELLSKSEFIECNTLDFNKVSFINRNEISYIEQGVNLK